MPEDASLLAKTARGAGWVMGWRLATRIIGLASSFVLLRLLEKEDFGLIALATAFAQTLESFSWIGIEDAVIREKNLTRKVYDTAFTLNIIRSTVTAIAIALLAGPAAWFYDEPRLADILFALSLGALLDGAINIGTVDFRRNFTFGREFVMFVVPRLASSIATVTVAVIWHSYWGLVVGIVGQRLLRVAFSYAMHPYRPRLGLSVWRNLVGYSTWTWALSVVVQVRDRVDTMLIGRMLGLPQVGAYTVAYEIAALPTTELVEPLTRAAFPGFAAARREGGSVRSTYMRIIASAAVLTLPAGLGISAIADPLVRLALTEKWLAAVPLIQILGLAGTVTVFGMISSTLFRAYGRMRTTFAVVGTALVLRILLVGLAVQQFGLVGAAWAAVISIILEQAANIVVTFRGFDLRLSDLLRQVWRPLCASAVMAAMLAWTGFGWRPFPREPQQVVVYLLVAAMTGAMVYGASLLAFWLASGRPAGAESDLLTVVRNIARGLLARINQRAPIGGQRSEI